MNGFVAKLATILDFDPYLFADKQKILKYFHYISDPKNISLKWI